MLAFELIIYFAMGALFVSGVILCLIPLIKVRRALSRGAAGLSERKSDGTFAYLDPYYLNTGYLDRYWVRFLNNLELMRRNHSVCEINDFINEQTAIRDPGRGSFGEMIPGMLTTLGIIGTFYGVVHGLSTLNISDVQAMEGTISTLLSGMRTAFNTSIVGAVLSLVFQILRRAVISGTERSLSEFVNACQTQIMSMLTPDATLIQIQYAILEELRRINRNVAVKTDRRS